MNGAQHPSREMGTLVVAVGMGAVPLAAKTLHPTAPSGHGEAVQLTSG